MASTKALASAIHRDALFASGRDVYHNAPRVDSPFAVNYCGKRTKDDKMLSQSCKVAENGTSSCY